MILVIFMVWFSRNLRENGEKGIEKNVKIKNKNEEKLKMDLNLINNFYMFI